MPYVWNKPWEGEKRNMTENKVEKTVYILQVLNNWNICSALILLYVSYLSIGYILYTYTLLVMISYI